jgi:hypothetical protein
MTRAQAAYKAIGNEQAMTATRQQIREGALADRAALDSLLPGLTDDAGRFALMRFGEVVEIFDDDRSALRRGRERYLDGLYSVQRIPRKDDKPTHVASPFAVH